MPEGLTTEWTDSDDASVFVRHAGSGTPVLLLHGHPRTSAGHDRGSLVAPRPALDHPTAVERLVLIDCLPVDREHEEADRAAHRRTGAPLRVLLSLQDDIEDLYGNPLDIWRGWADELDGFGIDSGHHAAEENPADLAQALIGHFRPSSSQRRPVPGLR